MKRRHQGVAEIEGQEFDVCVIGGGATGSGCALDSQLTGLNTVLVDTGDFVGGDSAGGTCSKHLLQQCMKRWQSSLDHYIN